MKIHESGENYLESILVIKQRQEFVRSIDIAKEMGFSKASVSRAVNKLKDNGYITIDENGILDFTEQGLDLATRIYDRHRFFTDFLIYLGVDKNVAAEDACKIEHVLSPESYQAMKKYLLKAKNKNI
ncbi:MAG: metal-dependent transcriptional regulator [Candidatus Izemoplasmatales bacterium]|nr:metal-dependent transcriptional regulator [Candidatus Izemoplasmatales bacterium]MDY0139732.1 metal-dependent transcriptional regulator [Candidatus Izemoplasmatales bacterium]